MSFELPQDIRVEKLERRTSEFLVNAADLRGDAFHSVVFTRESVFLDAAGNEVKRVEDPEPFEFTPETISSAPDLQQAIATIYAYMDGADSARMQAQNP